MVEIFVVRLWNGETVVDISEIIRDENEHTLLQAMPMKVKSAKRRSF